MRVSNLVGALILATALGAGIADAKSGKKKKAGHCHKMVDGEHEDLPKIKTKKACKKAGGKWTRKSHKKKHKDGDGHDHSHTG